MTFGEEQGRAAGLDDAVGDLANLQPRIDAGRDDVQLAGFTQRVDEGAERVKWHGVVTYAPERGIRLASYVVACRNGRDETRAAAGRDRSTVTAPSCARAIQRTIARPRPVPEPSLARR